MSRLDAHLQQILNCIQQKDGNRLKLFFILDLDNVQSEFREAYNQLYQDLNNTYPPAKNPALSSKIKQYMPSDVLGSFHTSFTDSIVLYLRYLRDYLSNDNLAKAESIERLVKQCVVTLDKQPYGPVMIPLVLSFVNVLRFIAINLDRNPDLVDKGKVKMSSEGDEGRITFVEMTADVVREAFNKCLAFSRPDQIPTSESAISGIYSTINSAMKLYNRVGKLGNLRFLLTALDQKSPPLSYYPAAQRVTFLYYLGRFHFANNHFYRAYEALQSAYEQCHREAIKHRKQILIHLIATNMCLGRLPGRILLVDQAAHDISRPFIQLCQIVKAGDIGRYRTFLDVSDPQNEEARWFLEKKILLQLRNRCEVIVWRTLVYRTMKYAGSYNTDRSVMPFVRYERIVEAAQLSFSRSRKRSPQLTNGTSQHSKHNLYCNPDFDDQDENGDTTFDGDTNEYEDGQGQEEDPEIPTADEINSIVLSLISQGFLMGFVQHTADPSFARSRFLIPTKNRSSSGAQDNPNRWKEIGFPTVWNIVQERESSHDDGMIPGWVTKEKVEHVLSQRGRPKVVHLTNVKAVG